jgi:hypothetical protein
VSESRPGYSMGLALLMCFVGVFWLGVGLVLGAVWW